LAQQSDRREACQLVPEDGRVAIDNNTAETRPCEPIGMSPGKKEELAVCRGRHTVAENYSPPMTIIETAKAKRASTHRPDLADIPRPHPDHKIKPLLR